MSYSPRVKICGITRPEDAAFAAECGADAIGLVFYPKSSRYLGDLGLAREVAIAAGPLVNVVGLFVNTPQQNIENVLAAVPLSLMQFHGDESPQVCEEYQRPYIKALRMKDGFDAEATFDEYTAASGFLLDTYVSGTPGGTGEVFDWQRVPKQSQRHIILAGGLSADNVAEAIAQAQPYAVDVSGGVEEAPGIKSHTKIKAFIAAAKSAQ